MAMDEVPIHAPALVYLKDMQLWLAVNNWGESISWTDEPGEVAWFLIWIQTLEGQMRNQEAASPLTRGRPIDPEPDNSTNFPGKIAAHGVKR